jgi:PTS system cellobiose-specific IIC component
MENLFNNPILVKMQEFGQKLGSNKFISALQYGMMSTMSILMVGAFCQIIASVGDMLGFIPAGGALYNAIMTPYNYTMGLIGVWVTGFIAYSYARNLKMKNPLVHAIDAIIVFVMTCGPLVDGKVDTTFLGATGMFLGFVIAGAVVRIEKLCIDKNIRIPMPDVCPPSLVNAFAAIVPLAINVIIFQGLSAVLGIVGLSLPYLLLTILMIPIQGLTSLPGMFIICFFALLLWCFGTHGTMIVYPILAASMVEAAQFNAAAMAAGEPLQWFPVSLFGAVALLGGTGNTWPLVLMGLRAKSEQIRAVSKASLLPGWFGINEPVAFGMPIMYNPILCIPYVLNPIVIMILYIIGYETGIIIPAWISITALMPMGFGAYFGTLNIMNAIWVYLMLIPSGLIWFPFFKIYDNQLAKQEAEAKAAAEQ